MYRGMVHYRGMHSMVNNRGMYCMVSNWGMSNNRSMSYKGGCSMGNNRATCKGSEWNLCVCISRGKS